MSPSEEQLRAALRQGEGAGPNVDAIVRGAVRARREQRERRVRVLSAVGAAVVVAGIAVGITQHTNRHQSSAANLNPSAPKHSSADDAIGTNAGGYGSAAGGIGGGAQVPGAYAGNAQTVPAVSGTGVGGICPVVPVSYALPGGGGTDQFGANGSLVEKPVRSLTFCWYAGDGKTTYLGSRVLEGADAQAWVDRADASTVTSDPDYCLNLTQFEILVVGADGTIETPLSARGICQTYLVTNGTAVRHIARSALDSLFDGSAALSPAPSSGMSGSPPR